jgi:hypothetical protein
MSKPDRICQALEFLSGAFEVEVGNCAILAYLETCNARQIESFLTLRNPERQTLCGFFRWVLIDSEWVRVEALTGIIK